MADTDRFSLLEPITPDDPLLEYRPLADDDPHNQTLAKPIAGPPPELDLPGSGPAPVPPQPAAEPTLTSDPPDPEPPVGSEAPAAHLIDLDAALRIPDGYRWSVREEDQLPGRARGLLVWDPTKVRLHLAEGQKNSKCLRGHQLRKELKDQPVLNANVLDHLLANPHLIPEDWKGKAIFFWGTIYRGRDGSLCVRYLYWGGGRWHWYYIWLGSGWLSDFPAALRAS